MKSEKTATKTVAQYQEILKRIRTYKKWVVFLYAIMYIMLIALLMYVRSIRPEMTQKEEIFHQYIDIFVFAMLTFSAVAETVRKCNDVTLEKLNRFKKTDRKKK